MTKFSCGKTLRIQRPGRKNLNVLNSTINQ